MRDKDFSKQFLKSLSKLKGQELQNVLKKIDEILTTSNLNHYKNLKKPLNKFKRVHVNSSYVILFLEDQEIVYFYLYEHHDRVYDI